MHCQPWSVPQHPIGFISHLTQQLGQLWSLSTVGVGPKYPQTKMKEFELEPSGGAGDETQDIIRALCDPRSHSLLTWGDKCLSCRPRKQILHPWGRTEKKNSPSSDFWCPVSHESPGTDPIPLSAHEDGPRTQWEVRSPQVWFFQSKKKGLHCQ